MDMFKRVLISTLALGWLTGVAPNVFAENGQQSAPAISPEMKETIGDWVDNAHEGISQQILGTADRFDGFFGDERIDEEKQNTQISLGMSTTFKQDVAPAFTFPIGIKVSLPRLKNRVQLAVNTLLREEAGQSEEMPELGEEENTELQVSLRYKMLEQVGKWVSVDGGVKMNFDTIGWDTLEPFGVFRFRATFDFDPWALRVTQFVNWYEQPGWSGLSRFELERYLGQNTFFRMSGTTEYAEEFTGQHYAPALLLRHQLSHNRAIGVQLYSEGHTHPIIQTDVYEALLTYRRRIYKEWAFFSIQPVARFTRDENFVMTPLLRFEFKLYFGRVAP